MCYYVNWKELIYYSETPLYEHSLNTDTRILRTVSFVPTKTQFIYFPKTRLIRTPVNTDNGHFSVSRVTNSHTLSTPLIRTRFVCALSIFNLSKVFSNIQSTWLSLKLKTSVQNKSHGLFQLIPLPCLKNNKVILVRDSVNE